MTVRQRLYNRCLTKQEPIDCTGALYYSFCSEWGERSALRVLDETGADRITAVRFNTRTVEWGEGSRRFFFYIVTNTSAVSATD